MARMNVQKEIWKQKECGTKNEKTFWEALMKSDELNLSKNNSGRNWFVKSLIKNANKYCKIVVYTVDIIFHSFFLNFIVVIKKSMINFIIRDISCSLL